MSGINILARAQKGVLGVALCGLMAAGTANAATIYNKGDVKWELEGDFQVQIRQRSGEDEDSFVDYDDAELKKSLHLFT